VSTPETPPYTFSPRTAIVTGSDSGIGRATAVALAQAGADVGITWHTDREGAEGTAKEVEALGRRAEVRQLDLTRLPGAAAVIDELADALGGVDVLVNNSGTGTATPLLDIDYDTWRTVLATDLDGAFLCLQRAARRMVAAGRGGRIVNITSVHEHQPRVGAAAYCAAKGGLGLLTRVAALELAEHGITVNAVAPGFIETRLTARIPVAVREAGRRMNSMAQGGLPVDVAETIAWLASPGSGGITGNVVRVCGQMWLGA
jgi:NAD(P)-dependent dehydrogenase (short-subunit alcohol dehydrogenase family)